MECHTQKYIEFGAECTKDALIQIMSFTTVMAVAGFVFATSGASLKTFTLIWAKGHKACHWTELTTTAHMRPGTADGRQQKSKSGTALLSHS